MKVSKKIRWTLAVPAGLLAGGFVATFVGHLYPEPHVWYDYLAMDCPIPSLIVFPIVVFLTGITVAPLHGKRFLTFVASLFVISCLFPPWQHRDASGGYSLLFCPPSEAHIDFVRLFLEWAVLAVANGMIWILFLNPTSPRDEKANLPHAEPVQSVNASQNQETVLAKADKVTKSEIPSEQPLSFWETVFTAIYGVLGLLGLIFAWPQASGFKTDGYFLKAKKTWHVYWLAFGVKVAVTLILFWIATSTSSNNH